MIWTLATRIREKRMGNRWLPRGLDTPSKRPLGMMSAHVASDGRQRASRDTQGRDIKRAHNA